MNAPKIMDETEQTELVVIGGRVYKIPKAVADALNKRTEILEGVLIKWSEAILDEDYAVDGGDAVEWLLSEFVPEIQAAGISSDWLKDDQEKEGVDEDSPK